MQGITAIASGARRGFAAFARSMGTNIRSNACAVTLFGRTVDTSNSEPIYVERELI
jgi:hypothetical protein